jgi:hypothetical protein
MASTGSLRRSLSVRACLETWDELVRAVDGSGRYGLTDGRRAKLPGDEDEKSDLGRNDGPSSEPPLPPQGAVEWGAPPPPPTTRCSIKPVLFTKRMLYVDPSQTKHMWRVLDPEWNAPAATAQDRLNLVKTRAAGVAAMNRADAAWLRTVPGPAYVMGDVHGNLMDLLALLTAVVDDTTTGRPTLRNPLVLVGDYVDRGPHSVQVVALLFRMLLLHGRAAPTARLVLLQGNHEAPAVNGDWARYGDSCLRQQAQSLFGRLDGDQAWDAINDAFATLPLACVVGHEVLCVHGGFPSQGLDALRGKEPPPASTIQEAVWSDFDMAGTLLGKGQHVGPSSRGHGIRTFSEVAAIRFLKQEGLSCMVRGHQGVWAGVHASDANRVITVFSTSTDHFPDGWSEPGEDVEPGAALVLVHTADPAVTVTGMARRFLAGTPDPFAAAGRRATGRTLGTGPSGSLPPIRRSLSM